MWLIIIGLTLGIVFGTLSNIRIPAEYSSYVSIAILAALDTLFGGVRAYLNKSFDLKVFTTGFFFNSILAAALAYIGVQLRIDLYMAAVFAFGVRLFNNIAVVRRILIDKIGKK